MLLAKEERSIYQKKRLARLTPHIWLDPVLAKYQVEVIRDAFIEVDPENASSTIVIMQPDTFLN
jgi:zinc transport system substrate-binding protein